MENKKLSVLYICHDTSSFGGAALSLENMLNSLDNNISPTILFRERGVVADYFESKGYKCLYAYYYLSLRESKDNRFIIKRYISYFKWYFKLRQQAKQVYNSTCGQHFDIIHSNSSVYLVGYFLARFHHAKHVWHVREFQDLDQGNMPIIGWTLMRFLLNRSDYVIAITNEVLKHWQLDGKNNACYRWNAVRKQADAVYIREKLPYFLFCSNIIQKKKGPDVAIIAFALSKLFQFGYRLKIVGNMIDKDFCHSLFQLVEDYGVKANVDFEGPTDNIKDYMVHATAFLMCSEFEGLGRVTVEAMFYGCPVIGHNTGGTKELIKHGQTGYLYSDTEECAKIMQDIIHRKDIATLITKAQMHAIKNFSEENYGTFMMGVYKHVLNHNSRT